MISILLETAGGVLNSSILLFTFLTTLIVYSTRKVHEYYWYSSNIACQKKEQIGFLKYSFFNDKNQSYIPRISALHFF